MRYEGRILCMGVCRVRLFLFVVEGKTSAVNNGEEMEEYAKIRYERMKKNMTYLG